MALRVSTRSMQTIRFVIDADASAAPFVYTLGQNVEICEIRTLTTAATGFVLTIRNGANSITTVTSGGAIGDIGGSFRKPADSQTTLPARNCWTRVFQPLTGKKK